MEWWEKRGKKIADRGKADPKCPRHGDKYDEDGNRLFRPPLMTHEEVTMATQVMREFTKSDHFKDVPEAIKPPIQSALAKFERMFSAPKPKPIPTDRLPKRKKR